MKNEILLLIMIAAVAFVLSFMKNQANIALYKKQNIKRATILFMDSILYLMIFSSILDNNTYYSIVIFAVFKSIGDLVSSNISNKKKDYTLKYEIIPFTMENAILLKEKLIENNFLVYTSKVRYKNKKTLIIHTNTINAHENKLLKQLLKDNSELIVSFQKISKVYMVDELINTDDDISSIKNIPFK